MRHDQLPNEIPILEFDMKDRPRWSWQKVTVVGIVTAGIVALAALGVDLPELIGTAFK